MQRCLVALFVLFRMISLSAEPIKVPTERYKGSYDKRNHPGHYPFISYLTFRNHSDIAIDDAMEWFDPDLVKHGDVIYINIWYLEWFAKHVHDRIKHPYILVSADVGGWLPATELKKLLYDPKLAAWFCRNIVFSYHPKLYQLPTGQDLGQFILDDPDITSYLLNVVNKKATIPKTHFLYMCHYPRSFGDRDKVEKMFENQPYCFTRNNSREKFVGVSRPQFYEDLAASEFVLSPLGLETDSVRTWEALVLDCIPIVEHTFLDPSYDNLPVIMVHDWEEVNPDFLSKKREGLKNRSCDEAYFDYWWTLIKGVQKKVQEGDTSFAALEATLFKAQDLDDFRMLLRQFDLENGKIFFKGFLSTLRPFQIAKNLSNSLVLYDPWLDGEMFNHLDLFVTDPSVLTDRHKVSLLRSEKDFMGEVKSNSKCTVFLDFTYYRTSLFLNFATSVVQYGNFRQSLRGDMNELYRNLNPHTLLCGNMASNDYVKECLEMFAKVNQIEIQFKGSFWFVMKR